MFRIHLLLIFNHHVQIFNNKFSAKIEFLCSTPTHEIQNLCAEDLMFGTETCLSLQPTWLCLLCFTTWLAFFYGLPLFNRSSKWCKREKSNHLQGLLPECLELVPVFLAELLSSLLCIHWVWLTGCSSLCHLAQKSGNTGVTKLTLPPCNWWEVQSEQ